MAGRSGHRGGRIEPPEATRKRESAVFRPWSISAHPQSTASPPEAAILLRSAVIASSSPVASRVRRCGLAQHRAIRPGRSPSIICRMRRNRSRGTATSAIWKVMWRAVDDEGEVLDMLVQKRRNTEAALRLLRKLLKHQGSHPEIFVTDGLPSYRSAARELGCQHRHRRGRMGTVKLTGFGRPFGFLLVPRRRKSLQPMN